MSRFDHYSYALRFDGIFNCLSDLSRQPSTQRVALEAL